MWSDIQIVTSIFVIAKYTILAFQAPNISNKMFQVNICPNVNHMPRLKMSTSQIELQLLTNSFTPLQRFNNTISFNFESGQRQKVPPPPLSPANT